MVGIGEALRLDSEGGMPAGAALRRLGAAIAGAIAALTALSCAAPPRAPAVDRELAAARAWDEVEKGGVLYAAGDFVLAARRFESAAANARSCGDLALERRTTAAECTSWLRARRLADLSACTLRLEALHRREHRSDPGLNTLIAMGAVAGGRPLPPFKVPTAVHPIVRAAAR